MVDMGIPEEKKISIRIVTRESGETALMPLSRGYSDFLKNA
jgi:hypothetical protein